MEKKATSKRYPPELKERAVRMVKDLRQQDPGDKAVISRVARESELATSRCGPGSSSPRSTAARAVTRPRPNRPRPKELRKEVQGAAPLQRHPPGGGDFLRGGARPPTKEVVGFIDAHRDSETGGRRWGSSRCAAVSSSPSTYYDTKSRPRPGAP